ncbi:di-heme oxidoredictase family protein [Salinarimonas chemoclinalis]|uniref:di-heme oxidoredictase family protein n=1 Tax=Salinarimonas chemoclinalis TaxID=3241599 RepID=UPI003555ECC0
MAKRNRRGAVAAVALAVCVCGIAAPAAPSRTVPDLAPDLAPEFADVVDLGATFSVYSFGQSPYNRSVPFLPFEERLRFSKGAEAFTVLRDGGADVPVDVLPATSANAPSCEACHVRDGRGPAHGVPLDRTGLSVVNHAGDAAPVFRYPATAGDGAVRLTDVRFEVAARLLLRGAETVELVRPVAFVDGVERPVDLRNAPGVYGLGLLEAIPDASIRAHALARPHAQLGIAGRVAEPAVVGEGDRVGRFGWKGSFPTLAEQVSHAVTAELGIVDGPGGGDPAFAALVADLTHYLQLLAVPARRPAGEAHRAGAVLFVETGCAMCHVPSWRTGDGPDVPERARDLVVHPFTDMLLHDMGEGLADPSGGPQARLWRTAPLWGIGVQHGVSPEAGFLHDGRARTLTEAILWHGGDATPVVDRFRALGPDERAALLAFLASL